jgi:DNA-binding response OmpR family regulator
MTDDATAMRVIVHESGRRWVEHVRARLHGRAVRVLHTATDADCLKQTAGEGAAVLIAELGARPVTTLELIDRAVGQNSDLAVVAVAAADQSSLDLAAREMGAMEFVVEPIAPRELADLVERIVRGHNKLVGTTTR